MPAKVEKPERPLRAQVRRRCPMCLTRLECRVSKTINSDACPRPTTQGNHTSERALRPSGRSYGAGVPSGAAGGADPDRASRRRKQQARVQGC